MLAAEDWAETNNHFRFLQREKGGYDFERLANFDALLATARKILAPYRETINRLLNVLIPMGTREAEVFATVHAAWNNQIRDVLPTDDDAIIRAARDDWHPDKQKIPVGEFRDAIRRIREHGLVPDGSAKRVSNRPPDLFA
tara:strand:+ start:979 stop:1401 length:423 start_codon:yes stop_codon:yes gene_type:complete